MPSIKVDVSDEALGEAAKKELLALRRKVKALGNKNVLLAREIARLKYAGEQFKRVREAVKGFMDILDIDEKSDDTYD